ncbi:hypothetical protein BHM03_00017662, partial [Ensete ventricosum]
MDYRLPDGTIDWGCFCPVTTRNRLVTIDFDRRRLLPSNISLAATRKREKKQGRRKRNREKKRENLGWRGPITARWWLDFFFVALFAEGQRRLQQENLGTVLRMKRTLRGDNFFLVVFSSSPSQATTRKRGGLCDVVKDSHPRREEKTRR